MTHPFYPTPEEAEEAFYEAVAQADLDALMAVWSDDEEILCIHPTGQRMNGPAAIRQSWHAIFEHNPRFFMRTQAKARWESALISVHCIAETLYVPHDQAVHGLMHSTHVFLRGTRGWRLVSRHTSAALPEQVDTGEESTHGGHKHTLH
ncbi:MAG: nuclear transport factor 2 family protein [Candidatus Accumulibacter sp.]|jgi:ketosteroid isomerase-like protein|nr:nuclear transport factor 2 family protein [Accumulibacter sp.]